jgi:hypothetical protein
MHFSLLLLGCREKNFKHSTASNLLLLLAKYKEVKSASWYNEALLGGEKHWLQFYNPVVQGFKVSKQFLNSRRCYDHFE